MPGDVIHYTLTVENDGENDMYYIVKLDFAGGFGTDGVYTSAGNNPEAGQSSAVATTAVLVAHGETDALDIQVVIPTTTGNTLQDQNVSVVATVYAIQAANMEGETPAARALYAFGQLTTLINQDGGFPADYEAPANP